MATCWWHILQCTDLDGTLIEDQAEQNDWLRRNDELTYQAGQHFAQYLAPAGGMIVYNTGRRQQTAVRNSELLLLADGLKQLNVVMYVFTHHRPVSWVTAMEGMRQVKSMQVARPQFGRWLGLVVSGACCALCGQVDINR